MSHKPEETITRLTAMPGILVIVTLGYLFVMHLGGFLEDGTFAHWRSKGLDDAYLKASSARVQKPVNRMRARLGLDANDVVRRNGELYYHPDIAHVAGRNFLEGHGANRHVVLKQDGPRSRETSPLPAILQFHRDLRSRGIELVLLPTPSKAMFAAPERAPMHNEGYAEFLTAMERHNIRVFDLAPLFADFQQSGNRLFLKSDSHWTAETMRMSSILLSAFLQREGLVPEVRQETFPAFTGRVTNSGDLARLLEVAGADEWTEAVEIHPLRQTKDTPWEPDRTSPVLLLGDSFTNIFSLAEMEWGHSAGLAESLSRVLGFSVDRLSQNADGAFASRRALQNDLARLRGKTVVVWQFAARELSFGDWRVLPLAESEPQPRDSVTREGAVTLEGIIARLAPVPQATRTPYRQAVMEIHLTGVTGTGASLPGELILLGMGVDNWEPTALTKWKVGQLIRVSAIPWETVQERYGRLRRLPLDDPEFQFINLPRMWLTE